MTRRMLINAQRPEELRIAIVHGKTLESYKVDVAESGVTRGNIYRGTIANIQPSLNAAFIDYGAERHGFLAIQDVVPEAYYRRAHRRPPPHRRRAREGQAHRGPGREGRRSDRRAPPSPPASRLAGRYLVLTPFDDTRGVSRKVEDEDTRKKLKAIAHGFELPDGCGVILRTNALEQTKVTLDRRSLRPPPPLEAGPDGRHAPARGPASSTPIRTSSSRRCATTSTAASRRCWSTTTRRSRRPRRTCRPSCRARRRA